jgi:hypothetical protein
LEIEASKLGPEDQSDITSEIEKAKAVLAKI